MGRIKDWWMAQIEDVLSNYPTGLTYKEAMEKLRELSLSDEEIEEALGHETRGHELV